MTLLHGAVMAVIAAALTLFFVSLAALGLVVMWINEEFVGIGRPRTGRRRSRNGNGCTGPRVAEITRGHITEKE